MTNHNSATYYSLTGHAPPLDDIRLRDTQELYPSYGSVVARFSPVTDPAIPTYISYPHVLRDGSVTPGQTASFLGKAYDPFFVGRDPNLADFRLPELNLPAETSLERLDDRRGLLRMLDEQSELGWSSTARGIDAFYDRALAMLGSPKVKAAFDLSREPSQLRDAYGRTSYGQSCLLARRLVEAGVRFVTVYYAETIGQGNFGGWDTHGENFQKLQNRLLPATDQTVPTFIEDMAARGLLDETPDRLDGRVRPLAQGGQHHPVRPQRPRPLAQVLHRPHGRRGDHSGRDLRLQRPDRGLSRLRSRHPRRHRCHHVLGPRDRPRHRGPGHPRTPLADRLGQAADASVRLILIDRRQLALRNRTLRPIDDLQARLVEPTEQDRPDPDPTLRGHGVVALDRLPVEPADHPGAAGGAMERPADDVHAPGLHVKASHDPTPEARVPPAAARVLSSIRE